jgi:hypothetical protein
VLYGSGHLVRNNIIYEALGTSGYNAAIYDASGSHSGTTIDHNLSNQPVLCEHGCDGADTSGGNILGQTLRMYSPTTLTGITRSKLVQRP